MKIGDYAVLIKDGFPPSIIRRRADGYYWRQPWHYSADWIRYDLPDNVIEPQVEELRDDTLDPHKMLGDGRVGKKYNLEDYKKQLDTDNKTMTTLTPTAARESLIGEPTHSRRQNPRPQHKK